MNASVVRSVTAPPALETTARSSSPAVQTPCASRPPAAATAKASASARPPSSGSSAAVAGSWPWWARPGTSAGSRGRRRRHACRRRRARWPCRAQSREASSLMRWCRARPTWPSRPPRPPRQVVDGGGLRGPVGGEAQQQRALAHHGDERVAAARVPQRPLRQPEQVRQRPPPRPGSAPAPTPCDTRTNWPGSPLPQSISEVARQCGAEQIASQPAPEPRRHARVARVAQQPPALAAADLPGGLALELEVEAAVVDRPRAVGLDQTARRRCRRSGPRASRPRRARGSRSSSARSAGGRSRPRGRSRRSAPGRSPPPTRARRGSPRARPRARSAGPGPPRPRRPSGSCRALPGVEASAVTFTRPEPIRSEPTASAAA